MFMNVLFFLKTNYQRGKVAEAIARIWLCLKGYSIRASRYRNFYGEIDLIVRKGQKLIAVEIKYRFSYKAAAESITWNQQQRIERTLQAYLATLPWKPEEIRFDVVLLSMTHLPKHLKNAWQKRN